MCDEAGTSLTADDGGVQARERPKVLQSGGIVTRWRPCRHPLTGPRRRASPRPARGRRCPRVRPLGGSSRMRHRVARHGPPTASPRRGGPEERHPRRHGGRRRPRPERHHRGRDLDRGHHRQAPGTCRRQRADRLRHVRRKLDRRCVVHRRRRGHHSRRARAPGALLPQGRRRPGVRRQDRRRSPRGGGPGPRWAHPARLARPHGVRLLDTADARRHHVSRARRAADAVLRGMLGRAEIEAARQRLKGAIYETPCPYSQTLSEISGVRCFVKLENLQMTGSFKERGAANLLLQLDPAERASGVAAASAGNHGLAVAFHAARLGIGAVIVMPEWAPLIKVTSARRYGAEVILSGANYDEAYGLARQIATERGLAFVHPFDDERVVAGQGTLGLELLEQCPDMDAVVVPVGGGGLVGGVALAIKAVRPGVRVIGVQAEALDAMKQALATGTRTTLPPAATIADGIAVRQVGEITLALAMHYVDDVVAVTEEELANAILLLLEIEKTVVEGAGAAPLAALLNRQLGLEGRTVVLVLSGGNIDVTMISRIIERGLVKDARLVRLSVILRDQPGALARLAALVGEARANILHIEHERAFSRAAIGESRVELTLETSGREQIEIVKRRLIESGYRVEERRA